MRWAWAGLIIVAVGCGDDDRAGTRPSTDAGGSDASMSDFGPPMMCETEADCDDGFDCTLDGCGVGGVCRHDPLSERCDDGLTCVPGQGCVDACTTDDDCQDGSFCNGIEQCMRGSCFPGRAADCDDGNSCTVDECSTASNGCVYEIADGCDAGLSPADGGMPPVDFDPLEHYDGRFLVAPAPSLGCPPASYSFGQITMTRTASELTVTADRFTLTQAPPPTGADFDVMGTDGNCPSVRLQGSFMNSNQLEATWNASCSGFCGSQTREIFGERVE
ncbi:MAG: hypothetical protein JJ863_22275 [Deltaproteobacteria bacterium]|nr:hypothetical protein [Deltaproteobacteria bacterium]